MKSFIFIILLVILLSQYECSTECTGTGSSKNDCNTRNLKEGEYKCCYYYWKFGIDISKECRAITKTQYENFKEFMETYEEHKNLVEEFTFDCNSNYIIISMLWLLLLLF